MTFKAVFLIALGLVGAAAVGIHLFAPELAHHTDRMDALREDAAGRSPQGLRTALELVDDTRARLALNVAYDLALEALAFRLERTLAAR